MAINYQQTDTLTSCTLDPNTFTAVDGGSAGSAAKSFSVSASTTETKFPFTAVPNLTSYAAGDYVVRLNVTTANMNLTITQVEVLKGSSTCSGLTVIADTGAISQSLASTGVLSWTIAGSSATALTTDKLIVRLNVSNGAMSAQSFGITPNQLFDTPLVAPADTGVGSAAGTGTATGTGASTAASTASATGTGTATGVGASTAAAIGSASGVGAATAVGEAINIQSGDGAASGVGTATGVGSSTAASAASASGVGAATAIGSSTAASVGAAAGVGTASGIGASTAAAVGAATGVGAATAVGAEAGSTTEAVGTASGIGSATGIGASTAAAVGSASGVGAASGVSNAATASTGGGAWTGKTITLKRKLSREQEVRHWREIFARIAADDAKSAKDAAEQAAQPPVPELPTVARRAVAALSRDDARELLSLYGLDAPFAQPLTQAAETDRADAIARAIFDKRNQDALIVLLLAA